DRSPENLLGAAEGERRTRWPRATGSEQPWERGSWPVRCALAGPTPFTVRNGRGGYGAELTRIDWVSQRQVVRSLEDSESSRIICLVPTRFFEARDRTVCGLRCSYRAWHVLRMFDRDDDDVPCRPADTRVCRPGRLQRPGKSVRVRGGQRAG